MDVVHGPVNTVRACGERAWLVEPPPTASPLGLACAVEQAARTGIVEVVPAAATVLVVHEPSADRRELGRWLAALSAPTDRRREQRRVVEIEVVYDGADLDDVARECHMSPAAVVARHSGTEYRCEFCGFGPGFGYLGGLDPSLHTSRRSTPRTRVTAGSLAIAGPYTAVYPSESPGGWNLIGRTAEQLWDAERRPPALITPGTFVRFRAVDRLPAADARPAPSRPGGDALRIAAAGLSTSIQDLGRRGVANLGVGRCGAADPRSSGLVNRLVGNPDSAAVLETAGGLVVEALRPIIVADSTTASVFTLERGATYRVEPRLGEAWAYLAVRGGIDVPSVLGSRSHDRLGGVGPMACATGDRHSVGVDPGGAVTTDQAPRPSVAAVVVTVKVRLGPRDDWFTDGAVRALGETTWTVSADRSRVGARLDGPVLTRRTARLGAELPSEGLVTGAIQVPPDGRPIVMLADHPTTGGYPVIAVVEASSVAVVAQRPSGAQLRFDVR